MKKTNTFKPIVIGTNDQEKQLHEANLSLILGYLNDFNEITDKYLPTFNKVSLKSNLFEAFKMQFQELHSGKFPELLSLDKILELSDVPTDKLRYLSQRIDEINKGILVNLATKEAPDKDFNIYTTSEDQNKLWKYLNEGLNMWYGGRQKGTPNNSTKEIRERITRIVDDTINQLDLNTLTNKERIDLIGKLLPYLVPKLTTITIDEPKHELFNPIEIKIINPTNEN